MKRRRPPLSDLHAFEAAARHLSFTSAADELCVTQSAVSQRVRKLEATLGVGLFSRRPGTLQLTPQGKTLAAVVGDSLSRIDAGLACIDPRQAAIERVSLRISAAPAFASHWLVPRLAGFRDLCPAIEIRLDAAEQHADIAAGQADLAIRFGRGAYPGVVASLLLTDSVFPVCSPGLLRRGPPLQQPRDLLRHVLLHDAGAELDASDEDWGHWFRSVGLANHRLDGPRFRPGDLALHAAAAGAGVALGRASIVSDDLAAGRLVQPLRHAVPTAFAYYLVHLPRPLSPHLSAFIEWLRHEVHVWQAVERSSLANPPPQATSFVAAHVG